ncbi:MAG: DUF2341 domain-containing protein, partial [Kiritimatiellae bacterium]|nr:DUF2341 domain-containing protein [Kiritimatiellia bacterium]
MQPRTGDQERTACPRPDRLFPAVHRLLPILCAAAIFACVSVLTAAAGAASDPDCEWVCSNYPARVSSLFEQLNLDYPGLGPVKTAVERSNLVAACEALVEHYRNSTNGYWLRIGPVAPGTGRHSGGDLILADTFTFQEVTGVVPRRADGGLNWTYTPNGDIEWTYFLNRHQWFGTLLSAWQATGNPDYPLNCEAHVRDWIDYNVPYVGAPWRQLESGIRMQQDSWPKVFFGFQACAEFSPAARILMLTSVPDHMARCQIVGNSNHDVIIMSGKAHAALCWPEFKEATNWFDQAYSHLQSSLNSTVYADGVQREMSYTYHNIVDLFDDLVLYAQWAGKTLPASYTNKVTLMWDYAFYSLRPNLYGPLTGDSDLRLESGLCLKKAGEFAREDWRYIGTNGREGARPADPPSRVWTNSGQMVMRSGWTEDGQWLYFDAGPNGGGHGHYDNLHVSIHAGGRDLLVDGGRYTYSGGSWRTYFKGSPSHNVILVDGLDQNDAGTANLLNQYAIAADYDFARGHFARGFGGISGVTHTRAVVYLRDVCWVVVDRMTVDQARELQAMWHFHPDCTVVSDGLCVASTDAGHGNLRIVPVGGPGWTLDMVKGQTTPRIQGWYSRTYNVKEANWTALYTGTATQDVTFAWIMLPGKGEIPPMPVETPSSAAGTYRVRFTPPGGPPCDVTVPMSGGTTVDWGALSVFVENRAPETAPDNAVTQNGTPVEIPVLANDSEPDGDALTLAGVSDPAQGVAVPNASGTIVYTPDPVWTGIDTFTYRVHDGKGATNSATVTVVRPDTYAAGMTIAFAGYDPPDGGTLTNFPVLVRLGAHVAGFSYGDFASAEGHDLLFTDAGATRALPYEIEAWDTNGESCVWVRVPALASSNNFIRAFWGNAAVADEPLAGLTGPPVWANGFAGVWHLGETLADSSAYGNDGENGGTAP